jgi:hypothetical protein
VLATADLEAAVTTNARLSDECGFLVRGEAPPARIVLAIGIFERVVRKNKIRAINYVAVLPKPATANRFFARVVFSETAATQEAIEGRDGRSFEGKTIALRWAENQKVPAMKRDVITGVTRTDGRKMTQSMPVPAMPVVGVEVEEPPTPAVEVRKIMDGESDASSELSADDVERTPPRVFLTAVPMTSGT